MCARAVPDALARVTREEAVLVSDGGGGAAIEIMPSAALVPRWVGENYVVTCNTSDGSRPRWYVGRPGVGEARTSIRGGTGGRHPTLNANHKRFA
ncbi:Facilitated trehalose transporter Tret1 [Frankliniella fusca]|uniref:Facilitated trehalose transporter Tret1 n=1 Tax=Frankliniella fusca TaxID=407009 RepID=A0AAE1H9A8_9NEOP|nr:Facilitated trehalose transporter Tret1 [Frankliniella fusca]